MSELLPFSRLVTDAMSRRGLGLRELCRRARLDPSFLSKVLTGKRNPPAEEDVLRRMAAVLETDAVELFVAAGRIPSEWGSLTSNPELLRRVDAMMHSGHPRKPIPLPSKSVPPSRSSTVPFYSSKPLDEELL
ncbi:MAG: helix-turn-helix domain-containing protein [Elusimicrobia bacterium]|nr:helix-turn-helix domain-containing protein [Elusimicrobiota bacterium]